MKCNLWFWTLSFCIVSAIGCKVQVKPVDAPQEPVEPLDLHCQLAVDSTDIVVKDHFSLSFQIPRFHKENEDISDISFKVIQIGGFNEARFTIQLWEQSKWLDVSDKGVFEGLPQKASYDPASRWFTKQTHNYRAREFNLKGHYLGVFMVKSVGSARIFHKLIVEDVPEVVIQDTQIASAPIILTVRPVMTDKGEVLLDPETRKLPE